MIPKFVTLMRRRWRLVITNQFKDHDTLGNCDHPGRKGKSIRIRPGLTEEKLLDTLLHEFVHASDWDKTEEWAHDFSTDVARELIRMGWRYEGEIPHVKEEKA